MLTTNAHTRAYALALAHARAHKSTNFHTHTWTDGAIQVLTFTLHTWDSRGHSSHYLTPFRAAGLVRGGGAERVAHAVAADGHLTRAHLTRERQLGPSASTMMEG